MEKTFLRLREGHVPKERQEAERKAFISVEPGGGLRRNPRRKAVSCFKINRNEPFDIEVIAICVFSLSFALLFPSLR